MIKIFLGILIGMWLVVFAYNKTTEKTVGYDYDSTLAFSSPTFHAERQEHPSDRMNWDLLNGRLLQLEKKKRVAWTVPVIKVFGYTPIVITSRPEVKGDIFRVHVLTTYGVNPEDVYMTKEKSQVLLDRHTVLFLGDSDGDIIEAQKAGVRAMRVKRSADDEYKENYHIGKYGEYILPFSDGHL